MSKSKSSTKKKSADITNLIDPAVRNNENKRCSEWNGDEENCKSNKCWFYRNNKKCKAHLKMLGENKTSKKNRKLSKRSRHMSKKSRKPSKRSKKSKSKSKRKSKRRSIR